jgi:hypothetical protein
VPDFTQLPQRYRLVLDPEGAVSESAVGMACDCHSTPPDLSIQVVSLVIHPDMTYSFLCRYSSGKLSLSTSLPHGVNALRIIHIVMLLITFSFIVIGKVWDHESNPGDVNGDLHKACGHSNTQLIVMSAPTLSTVVLPSQNECIILLDRLSHTCNEASPTRGRPALSG